MEIDGAPYAVVEDAIMPLDSTFTKESFQLNPMVVFRGVRYSVFVKGAAFDREATSITRICRYINEEGQSLHSGLEFLKTHLASFYAHQQRPSTTTIALPKPESTSVRNHVKKMPKKTRRSKRKKSPERKERIAKLVG